MKIIKLKIKKLGNEGSALILTVIVLVNALLIVSAITAISVQQKKQASKIKNSTPAFQLADSGIEYVLAKKGDSVKIGSDTICGELDLDSRADCNDKLGLDGSTQGSVYVYFLKDDSSVEDDEEKTFLDIKWIRAVGVYGQGSEKVSRSLQVQIKE